MTGLPAAAEVLGPVPDDQAADGAARAGDADSNGAAAPGGDADSLPVRALIRVPRAEGSALARALQSAQATRSPRKDHGIVRVQLDPAEVL